MRRSTRREFLSQSTRVVAAAGIAGTLAGCPQTPAPPVNPTSESARVFTVRGQDLRAMARDVLDDLGGIGSIVKPGEAVFIKVNMMTAGMLPGNVVDRGECTKPEIAMTVAEECLKAGAWKVTVGDAAQVDHFSWKEVPSLDGLTNYAAEAERLNTAYGNRVVLACLMGDSPSWAKVPSPYTSLGTIKIASAVMEADRIISVPVFKTHMMTGVTGSVKNFFGVTPAESAGIGNIKSRINCHFATGGVEQVFLDVFSAIKPHLGIVDLSVCVEGNGPVNIGGIFSARVDMRELLGDFVMLASTDLVAADATATRIISHDPEKVKHLHMAYNQGLGQIQEDKIEVVGESIESLRVKWTSATFAKNLPAEASNIPPYNCRKIL